MTTKKVKLRDVTEGQPVYLFIGEPQHDFYLEVTGEVTEVLEYTVLVTFTNILTVDGDNDEQEVDLRFPLELKLFNAASKYRDGADRDGWRFSADVLSKDCFRREGQGTNGNVQGKEVKARKQTLVRG